MKRLILLFFALWTGTAFAVVLQNPVATNTSSVFTYADGLGGNYWSIGSAPIFNAATTIKLIPSNVIAVETAGATAYPICYTLDGTTPTAPTAGTCGAGSTLYSGPLNVNGTVTLKFLCTHIGDTNSAVVTTLITIQPFFYPAGTYAYSPAVTLVGIYGQPLIYTTNGSSPTSNTDCSAANGTAGVNGTTIPVAVSETVRFASCQPGGVLSDVQSAAYVIQASTTWYIRQDGGTRYDLATVPAGQCDGKADVAYPGTGTNQHCAFNDFRYLWDLDNRAGGIGTWVIAGGDTVIVRGCSALATQSNPANPTCRIGWDQNNGGATNSWCFAVGNQGCTNPLIPYGDATHHTRFLGGNYAACATGGQTDPRNYASRLAQIFGGFGLKFTFDLRGAQYVDMQCMELTTHNGVCVRQGFPAYPRNCNTGTPDDFADIGISLDPNSQHIFMTDVYIHGFSSNGMYGPFGSVTKTRVFNGFNTAAGFQMDDGFTTPDAPGASLVGDFVTMIGNGCAEEYPIVHAFSAMVCYDDVSNGFGDQLSGQDTLIDTISWTNSTTDYNTKDGFIGPHPQVAHLTLKGNEWQGNMGSPIKLITAINADALATNNLVINNCGRMSAAIPGAPYTYAAIQITGGSITSNVLTLTTSTQAFTAGQTVYVWGFNSAGGFLNGVSLVVLSAGLSTTQIKANFTAADTTFTDVGYTNTLASAAFLSDYCRAGGNLIASNGRSGANITFANNTFISPTDGYQVFFGCGSSANNRDGECGTTQFNFTNNIFLGYFFGTSNPPGLFGTDDVSVVFTNKNNVEYANKPSSGETCGVNGNVCTSPLLVSQPANVSQTSQTFLDSFNFHLTGTSPAITAGTAYTGQPSTDYYGTAQTSPLTIGAVVFAAGTPTASTPTFSPVAPYTGTATTLTMSSTGAIICYNTTGATITIGGSASCPAGSTLYTAGLSVGSTTTYYAVAGGPGWLDSSLRTGLYTITVPASPKMIISGTINFTSGASQ